MDNREQALLILKKAFTPDDAYKLLEYLESRMPEDVATQKDVYTLKLEIEKVRAEIEKVRADLSVDIGKVRVDVEKVRADLLKWSFAFWVAQMALLAGILYKLLS